MIDIPAVIDHGGTKYDRYRGSLTEALMPRFMMTLDDAVDLVLYAFEQRCVSM